MDDKRNNIVDGPPKFSWPWKRGTDLDIGSRGGSLFGDSTVDQPARAPKVQRARARRATQPATTSSSAAPWYKALPVQIVLFLALAYHLLGPGAALLTSSDVDARGLLTLVDTLLPSIAGFDVSRWVIPGAAAWMWQPILPFVAATVIRMTALNTAQRDPLSAIWIGVFAAAIDTVTWLFIGLKLTGIQFSAEEADALITLLKVEGGALLVLFFILAPTGKRRLGQTDADWHGDN